jgi:scyllo-inositol 2-dehydrogenase (NADP+)
MTIRVGVAGYGLGGATFHGPVVQAVHGLELAAVSTSRPDRAPPGVRRHDSAEQLVADPDIDLVVVTTPNPTHFPLAAAALEAGKHVVIDKPFAVSSAEAWTLRDLAAQRGRLVVPFHNRRWDGDFLTVKGLIESGRLGQVMLYEAHWDRFRTERRPGWKDSPDPGVGLIWDLGPHLIDQAMVLFGRPDSVLADVETQRHDSEVNDYFELTFRYGRMRAVLACSTLVAHARPRFSIHGTRGSFVKFGLDPQEAALKAGERPGDAGFGEEPEAQWGLLTSIDGGEERVPTQPGRYVDFYGGVLAAIETGSPVPVEAADAAEGLGIIEDAVGAR